MLNEVNHSFFIPSKESFLTEQGRHYSPQQMKKTTAFPFKDHPQFPVLCDSLLRKQMHHVILETSLPWHLHVLLIEAFLQHLAQDNIPLPLKQAELIYLNTEHLNLSKSKQKTLEKEIAALQTALDNADKYLLLALSDAHLFSKKTLNPDDTFLQAQFEILLRHPKCRFILLSNITNYKIKNVLKNEFTILKIARREADVFCLLKHERAELESFHHVLIPEEALNLAYLMAGRYLSAEFALEKALLLLDSSAARLNTTDKTEHNNANRPILMSTQLLQILSNWTEIPVSHLALHKFKFNDFLSQMEKQIFGQETALTLIGQALQHAEVHLQKNTGPFAHFLFVGREHAGKETAALALTEYLFKQTHMFYTADMRAQADLTSLLDLKLHHIEQHHYMPLKAVIQEKPYAVFFLKDIEHAGTGVLQDITEILKTGFLHQDGKSYYFRQAIFLLSTALGSGRLLELAEDISQDEDNETLDLMELIMQEQKQQIQHKPVDYVSHTLNRDILSDIAEVLPATFCQQLQVIPFLLPPKSAIQNIIHLKLKQLGKMLESRYGIELAYAPEVIRYLSNDYPTMDIDKVLNQLYATIEQALFSQLENKNRPNQLFLQLNETGQSLRCDWLAISPLRHHAG